MKEILLALFSESGSVSMIRVLSFICVITASSIAIHAITMGSDLNATAILCGTFLGAGITGKVAQKSIELYSKKGDS